MGHESRSSTTSNDSNLTIYFLKHKILGTKTNYRKRSPDRSSSHSSHPSKARKFEAREVLRDKSNHSYKDITKKQEYNNRKENDPRIKHKCGEKEEIKNMDLKTISKNTLELIAAITTKDKTSAETKTSSFGSSLNLEELGKLSKQKLINEKLIKLPEKNNQITEVEKKQFYKNMYKLLVTARNEIQKRDSEIEVLNKRLQGKSTVECPSCNYKFNTDENRLMPKYIKVLQSTNRVELQFTDREKLTEWLIMHNLDKDKSGIPVLIPKQVDPTLQTLSHVKSSLALTKEK